VADAREVASESVVAVEGSERESPTVEVDEERLAIVVQGLIQASVEGSCSPGNGALAHRRHFSGGEFREGTGEKVRCSTVGNGSIHWTRSGASSEVVEERLEVGVNGRHESTLGTSPLASRSPDSVSDARALPPNATCDSIALIFHNSSDIIHFVERQATPMLLPILRSQQQGQLLAWMLDDPARECSLAELSRQLNIPAPSIHLEIERAEVTGVVTSRMVGRTRLVKANPASRLFAPLIELLVMSFGVPHRLRGALAPIPEISAAYIFGSWAARFQQVGGTRAIGDIDILILGSPDRDAVYQAVASVEPELGYPVQVTFRSSGWLDTASDSFRSTVASRPLVQILGADANATNAVAAATPSRAH